MAAGPSRKPEFGQPGAAVHAIVTSLNRIAIVLVGPEQAANVGFVARTMACYALSDLRIVGSPGIARDGAARKTGTAAPEILENARYFPCLEDAVRDCALAFGFTRRERAPAQRIEDLSQAAAFWRGQAGASATTALVFGRESQGLFKEETLSLSHLVRIPVPSETLSLNVSHALAIGLHAFLSEESAGKETDEAESGNALAGGFPERGETAQVLQSLLDALESGGFFKGGKQEAQTEYVRILWQRLQPNRRELDFLTGLLRNLNKG